ncbi:6-hydroxymethylpterin diphosphokinase MptE-like protein [Thiomicrorhabdus sp.]|uniref:6-hydroxymethylpterin diphosphokinase MptE-like protein n=1 Tax=Thiomicrorhabdus sp. TaxID=2039724 RepID=UPI002AA6BF21|nr:6-hydroxymethylpterin diphosphokinase MptE-like protein [Thiomicrorhabdus sp.]
MTITNTAFNETVLTGYYPEVFKQHRSSDVYRQFVGTSLPENQLFVVLGTDSGLLLDYLAQISTSGQRFICLDFPEVIESLNSTRPNLTAEYENFKFELFNIEDFDLDQLYTDYRDYIVRNAVMALNSIMASGNEQPYQGVSEKMTEAINRFSADRQDNQNFKQFYDCQLENLSDLMHPISKLENKLDKNVPAIVLGGGPSLDGLIPWIKENQDKLWIFAVSRICGRLKQEGITPDFIGVVDPQPLMFDYSREMYLFQEQSVLITGNHPCPTIIRQWGGLKTYAQNRFPWRRGSENNFDAGGPTVSNSLFGAAVCLGLRNIYLAGVDLCFTPEGKTHESASVEARKQVVAKGEVQVTNYLGEMTTTNLQLYMALNSFENQLMNFKAFCSNLNVFNLSETAAVAKGISYQATKEIDLVSNKQNAIELFSKELAFDAETTRHFLKEMRGQINQHVGWLNALQKISQQGQQLASTLFEKPALKQKRINEIIKLKKRLEGKLASDYSVMVNYAYDEFMQTLKPLDSEQAMSNDEISQSFIDFFSGIRVATKRFIEKLEKAQEEIKFRENEITQNVDFEALVHHWIESGVPGRFYVWLDYFAPNSIDYYKENVPGLVADLDAQYAEVFTSNKNLDAKFEQTTMEIDPAELINRLLKAFQASSLEEVQEIYQQLENQQDAELLFYKKYTATLIMQLQGQEKEALIHLITLDPNYELYLIQNSVYPLAVKLEDYEVAIKSLQSLCQVDINYLPRLANLIAFLGNSEGAIELLKQYPNLFKDTSAVLDLINLLASVDKQQTNQIIIKAQSSSEINQQQLSDFLNSIQYSL